MMSKKRPQLRFEGFTDDWEEHKLGDFLKTPEKVKAHIQSKDDLMTLKLNLGGLESGSNRETLELGSTIYYKRKAGQFIYGKQNFFNGSMAIIPIDLDGKATSGDVPSLDVIGILSEYLYVYVSRGDYWKSKESEASGTGSKRIHEKTLQGFDIKVPSTQNEQRKIGSFFKQLDDTIALHQRKLDLLKEQKKGYLQKMFPKNGAKVPELRFAGFADDWEERKLSEMAGFSKGNGYSKADLVEKGHPVILYGRLYTKYETVIEKVDTFAELKEKSVISNGGEVIVPASGETPEDISRASVVDVSGVALGGDLNIIKTKSELDPTFLALTISNGSQQKEMTKRAQGKSVVHLHNSDLKEVNLLYPKLDEQVKIGSFFKKLDVAITLHQRKLDLLKETKKGFLQKMFV